MARSLGDGEDRARGQGIRSSGASFRRHPTLQALRRAGLVESDALIDAVQRWGSGPGGSEDEARSTIADLVREGPVSSYWHAVLHGLRSELVAAQDLQLAAGTGDGLGLGLAWTTPTGDTRPWWRPGPRRAACLRDLEGAILHAHLGRDLAQAARKALVEMSAEGYAEFLARRTSADFLVFPSRLDDIMPHCGPGYEIVLAVPAFGDDDRPSLLFPSWLVAIDTTSPADQLEHITRTPETLTKLWNHFATAVRREQADCRPMTLDGVSFFMGESRPDRRDGRKRRFYNYVTIVAEVAGRIVLANSLELFRQALPRLKTGSPEAAVTGDQVVLDPVQLATFMRRNRETLVDLEFLSGAENRKTAAETLDRELEELNARGVLRLDFDHEGGKSRLTIHEAEGSLPR